MLTIVPVTTRPRDTGRDSVRSYDLFMVTAVPFPNTQPDGYEWFDDEPVFDPAVHLALESPTRTYNLLDLGYRPNEIESKATDFAVSEPFRVLSDEGAAAMLDISRRLRAFHRRAGDRVEQVARGGCYRSRFLRDLCINPELTAHLASIYGTEVAPHPMPVHLGHLNFEPSTLGDSVDKWHHDTLPLDFVMMVTDPATLQGGQFEWFRGTKAEAAQIASRGERPPRDRVVAPEFPGPGYTIALHGNMVVHRAAGLTAPGERITMVNGYVATDTSTDDQSRSADLIVVDDHHLLWAEWARFAAWRSAGRLQAVIDEIRFGTSASEAADALENAIADAQKAAELMRAGEPASIGHYEHSTN